MPFLASEMLNFAASLCGARKERTNATVRCQVWSRGFVVSTFAQVGAFALAADSKDSALIVTLPPGGYTAQVSGVGGTTGIALVEVYEVP